MRNNLQKKFDAALKIFANKYKTNPNVLAIFVFGSYVYSALDKNSDLDVYILLKKANTRERGNTWINGIEIEYFINPINQVRSYFKAEKNNGKPVTAQIFVNSKIIYQKDESIKQLIKEAKNILKKNKSPLKKIDLEIAKYKINDIQKNLEDVYLKNDLFAFLVIANNIIQESLNLFCKINRIFKEKPKRLQIQLKSIDKNFEKLYTEALIKNNINKKYKNINKLVSYIEKLIGGKRPKEWRLRSKCSS